MSGNPQDKQAADAAKGACGSILNQLPASGQRQQVTPAMLRTWRQLAACLRQHGLPQWPDPRPDGSFPLSGGPYASSGKSPQFIRAINACDQYARDGIRVS
jgi:hypothetical protein